MTELTTKQRFNKALWATRKEGVKVLQNVRECCRSCIGAEKLGLTSEEQPFAYTYGGQGFNYVWGADGPYAQSGKKAVLYFNHDNGGGQKLYENLVRFGFEPEWNGTDNQCVILRF